MRWAAAPIPGTSDFCVAPITATGTRRAAPRVSLHRDRCLSRGRASVGLTQHKTRKTHFGQTFGVLVVGIPVSP